MTTNFLAILRGKSSPTVRRIIVTKAVQSDLAKEFARQEGAFLVYTHRVKNDDGTHQLVTSESERIDFFPIYSLNDTSQMFEIDDFALEPPILSAAKDPDSVEALILNEETIPAIRAICAVQASRSSVRILFQSFDRRRILTTNRFTFLQDGNAFTPLDKPGLTFGDAINAVYDNGSLLFRSYAVTARFLSLVEVFNEASEDKMKEVLDHKVLHVANIEAVLKQSDSTMRKQFAAISELGVLEKAKPNVLKDTAAEFGIALGVERHGGKLKVEFPETKKQQKEFLTFLTEGYYVGPITGNKYQSNSHRPMKTKDGKK